MRKFSRMEMADVYVEDKREIDIDDLRNESKNKDFDKLLEGTVKYGNDNDTKSSSIPTFNIKVDIPKISNIIPQNIINEFTQIMGVDHERAKFFYDKGARCIPDLIKNTERFDLNTVESYGCLHFHDLLTPIDRDEEYTWKIRMCESMKNVEGIITHQMTRMRPSGIHSRIEVCVCVCDFEQKGLIHRNVLSIIGRLNEMEQLTFEGIITSSFNNGSEESTMCRIQLVCLMNGKARLLDITVYLPMHHPYPCLREHKDMINGHVISDDGICKDGMMANFRSLIGRDVPMDIEELKRLIG